MNRNRIRAKIPFINKRSARARAYYIGAEIVLRAKIHARKLKKSSMDGNVKAEPCTRKLTWFRSTTCMDGLKNQPAGQNVTPNWPPRFGIRPPRFWPPTPIGSTADIPFQYSSPPPQYSGPRTSVQQSSHFSTAYPWTYHFLTPTSKNAALLRVAATKWGICVHKVPYLCTQSGVFVFATPRRNTLISLRVLPFYP